MNLSPPNFQAMEVCEHECKHVCMCVKSQKGYQPHTFPHSSLLAWVTQQGELPANRQTLWLGVKL